MLDKERSAEMTSQLLDAIVNKRATHVVIDVTAVDTMDVTTVTHFIRMASAIGLLGTACVLTGIRPGRAGKLVKLGFDIGLVVPAARCAKL